jgi:hypothetical protein
VLIVHATTGRVDGFVIGLGDEVFAFTLPPGYVETTE